MAWRWIKPPWTRWCEPSHSLLLLAHAASVLPVLAVLWRLSGNRSATVAQAREPLIALTTALMARSTTGSPVRPDCHSG